MKPVVTTHSHECDQIFFLCIGFYKVVPQKKFAFYLNVFIETFLFQ